MRELKMEILRTCNYDDDDDADLVADQEAFSAFFSFYTCLFFTSIRMRPALAGATSHKQGEGRSKKKKGLLHPMLDSKLPTHNWPNDQNKRRQSSETSKVRVDRCIHPSHPPPQPLFNCNPYIRPGWATVGLVATL